MRSSRTLLSLLFLAGPATAQQAPPDPAFLQKAIAAVQTQRNAALDGQAACEASRLTLAEENEKLKARIKEIEAKK